MVNLGCKSKTILSYLMKYDWKCHKSCVLQQKDNRKFIQDQKTRSCGKPKEHDEEISILEKTIEELTKEIKAKNKFIVKQSKENSMLMEETVKVENELNELIDRDEKTIAEAKTQIR